MNYFLQNYFNTICGGHPQIRTYVLFFVEIFYSNGDGDRKYWSWEDATVDY